ncbi:WcaF family extracellular polysaccharide biosynthesis acetyltransferase [Rhodopirellula sallentina]|uniref:Colanic acid biosynthesis acetyltransferase WcaF n=1 Tax=Rhodopirellula sallentina SM41 TaxID=1263870 RepID=M5U0C2_9BACT|nr:WcaF family extracellular polysaccharide biosynthesis acetyltransferase [Rhodopirellula sallentina]EMI54905.1 colanic acid biosynthesis acetyltransferase WcaF [Rhodopirellula sallentina SM41]
MNQIELHNYRSNLDRGASRFTEYCWLIIRAVFFIVPLPFPSCVRVAWLRFFGATVGNGVVIRSGVWIAFPWRLFVGDHVWIGEQVMMLNLDEVVVETNCCISQRAFLCTGSHRFDRPGFDLVTKSIEIKEGSWVAAQAFVAPGVTIGPNSMCVAGSVVLKDVPPNTTVIGNPARPKSS